MMVLFDMRRLPRRTTRAQWKDIWHRYRGVKRKLALRENELAEQLRIAREKAPDLAIKLAQRLINPPIVVFCDPLMIEDRTPLVKI